jgi:hypothetical protein
MRDLLQYIVTQLPKYLADFGAVLARPKTFIDGLDTQTDLIFKRSLLFLTFSLIVVIVMTAPLLRPGQDLWMYVGARAVGAVLCAVLGALVLRTSWWLVGGRAPMRSFFVIYAYFFSVGLVCFTLVALLSEGVLKVLDPDLYQQVLEARMGKRAMPDVVANAWSALSFAILLVGYFALVVWTIIGWGAYRKLNGLTRACSFYAYLIMWALCVPATAVVYFVQAAITQ